MKDIIEKISSILLEEDVQNLDEGDFVGSEEFDLEEIYSDVFVRIRNMDEFYNPNAPYKASLLLESFLLETMVLLKKNPENIVVESGEFYVKATSFTPDGFVLLNVFEDVVQINSMIEVYNEALEMNHYPKMDIGIGVASFFKEELFEHEHDHEHEHDESCELDHDHEDDDFDYGIDLFNTASVLSEYAGSDEIEPILINEMANDLLLESDEEFFGEHLSKIEINDEFVAFQGNIVSEE